MHGLSHSVDSAVTVSLYVLSMTYTSCGSSVCLRWQLTALSVRKTLRYHDQDEVELKLRRG